MLFTVAAHTNTRWILGMIALGCVLSTLLSMVILWVGLGLWVALTWSVYQNSKGHSSWFTQWIPKQINTLNVSWGHLSTTDSTDINPNEGDENEKSQKGLKKQDPMDESRPTTIHVYTNLMHQWWIRSAFLMLGATVLGWFSIYCGWIPGALASLVIPCIVALLGHKQPSDPSTNRQHPDAISMSIPPETSWMGLHTWLQNHHSVLPTTGTLVFHHSTPASTIPFVLPTGFTEWTVQSQSNPIEA